ncbi:hypothetical protein acsn021_23700 [Anaerocolumna cellulosilytica]|uniref:Uncharacterized protein n=1 Tax=Anaerocolumna cellulosilytica TaxID=433286 RepID=A0A6S6R714_9FIRM|nr:hypothetical protein [Anaerocolumna cellulosilytica]MBB5193985.1 hypothetical protein [Anaerocolumna cellulosilytica]BCJ94801.1 hypothetical protein acsn021_23700 [Anaerocolumna cellulosilytica]
MNENNKTTTELQEAEVNVYTYGCGDPKYGCMVDCINLTPWITTEK